MSVICLLYFCLFCSSWIGRSIEYTKEVDLVINHPRNHETIFIPHHSFRTDIHIDYNLTLNRMIATKSHEIDLSQYKTCVEMIDSLNDTPIKRNECFPANTLHIQLKDIPVGDYVIILFTILLIDEKSNQMVSDKKMIRTIIEREELHNLTPPILSIQSYEYMEATNTMTIVTPYNADSALVSISYKMETDIGIPFTELEFCLKIIRLSVDTITPVLDFTCIELERNPFTLNGVQIDNYVLMMALRNKLSNKVVDSSKKSSFLSIRTIESSLPTITFPSCNKVKGSALCISKDLTAEGVINQDIGQANFPLVYQLFGFPSSYQNVQVCIEVINIQSNFEMLPYNCLPTDKNKITLNNMKVGQYQISFVLATSHSEEIKFEKSRKSVILELRYPQEFIPNYSWQRLHAWHTIPSGLETRLPLSDGSMKEARIPNPWRLQITMPDPCRYFLRMDIYKDTTIQSILEEASTKCNIDVSCFELYSDDRLLENQSTAEDTHLFNIQPVLLLKPNC